MSLPNALAQEGLSLPLQPPLRARTDSELAEDLEAQAEAETDATRAVLLKKAARLLAGFGRHG